MKLAEVLRRKGDQTVVTVRPGDGVRIVLDRLAEHGIGALVVVDADDDVVGIVSERDIVRRLRQHGPEVLDLPVSEIMTTEVHTCPPDSTVEELMVTMTEHRIRHVPLVLDGRMVGIVSIGDVVKNRIDDLQTERDHLEAYITR